MFHLSSPASSYPLSTLVVSIFALPVVIVYSLSFSSSPFSIYIRLLSMVDDPPRSRSGALALPPIEVEAPAVVVITAGCLPTVLLNNAFERATVGENNFKGMLLEEEKLKPH